MFKISFSLEMIFLSEMKLSRTYDTDSSHSNLTLNLTKVTHIKYFYNFWAYFSHPFKGLILTVSYHYL